MLKLKIHHCLFSEDERLLFRKISGTWKVSVLNESPTKIQDTKILDKYKMDSYKTYKELRSNLEKNFKKEKVNVPSSRLLIINKYSLKDYPGLVIVREGLNTHNWTITSFLKLSPKQALELNNFSANTRREAIEFLEQWIKYYKISSHTNKL